MTPVPQAGGIVLRKEGDRLLVLLVRAKKDPSLWIFPKGHIEPGETASDAALRETREEAGVTGDLVGPVGDLEFHNGSEFVRVQYFLIRPRAESAATDGRAKRWFAVAEAVGVLRFEGARQLLRAACDRAAAEHIS